MPALYLQGQEHGKVWAPPDFEKPQIRSGKYQFPSDNRLVWELEAFSPEPPERATGATS